jgi:hypothetical protein
LYYTANIQRTKIQEVSSKELKILTEDLRSKVMKKEKEVEDMIVIVKNLKNKRKNDFKSLHIILKKYQKKYQKLVCARRENIIFIQKEIKQLRGICCIFIVLIIYVYVYDIIIYLDEQEIVFIKMFTSQ